VKSRKVVSESGGWETVARETHFQNDHLEVATEEIRTPARPVPRAWTVVYRKRAVVIAPMTPEGKIILIRQERIPIRAAIWEMPAGQIDEVKDQDTDAIEAVALRELREETGFELAEGGELISLGDYFTSPGFTDERGYFFLARPVRPSAEGHTRDESESILDCQAFSAHELSRMIDANEIRDANTLGICARLVARGLLSLDRK
jgi:8-oxo-dGTP pyrophosphatase MutT (NUDIX family)